MFNTHALPHPSINDVDGFIGLLVFDRGVGEPLRNLTVIA